MARCTYSGQDLLPSCGDYQLFFRHDIHATMPAVYCYARAVVNRIAAEEHRAAPWQEPLRFHPVTISDGGLSDYLSLLKPLTESINFADVIYDLAHPPGGGTITDDPAKTYAWIYRAPADGKERLPPVVLFGNSFSDHFISSGMPQYFSEVYRGFGTGMEMNAALRHLPPEARYFIFQFWDPTTFDLRDVRIPAGR
jgi:hypothetical protein